MKLTKDHLRKLIKENLAEADLTAGLPPKGLIALAIKELNTNEGLQQVKQDDRVKASLDYLLKLLVSASEKL